MTENVKPDGAPLAGEPRVPAPPSAPAEPAKVPADEKKSEPTTIKAAAAPSEVGASSNLRLGSASNTGPESLEEELADEEVEAMAEEEDEMVAAQPKPKRSTRDIDWTESGFKPEPERKGSPVFWVLVLALGAFGLVLIFLSFSRRQGSAGSNVATRGAGPPVATTQPDASSAAVASPEPPKRPQRGKSDFPTPPASLPPARVQTPKSLSDLKIGNFAVNPRRPGDELTVISGDIENVSDNLHRSIRIELDLLDAQGLKIATVNEFVTELAARATWHVLARTTNARAASARLTGIKEAP